MANPSAYYKLVHEKRLVLVDACEAFQRAASRRASPFVPGLSHEERSAFDYLQEALKNFNLVRTGNENG